MNRKNLLWKKQSLIVVTLLAGLAGSAFAGSKYQVIHRFQQTGILGTTPIDLISDGAGNLYGTTDSGGEYGYGTVFELSPPGSGGDFWTKTLLYSFRTGAGVYHTAAGGSLVLDQSGNVYGVSTYGGHGCSMFGCGYVFKLTAPTGAESGWTESTLYTFSGWDGFQPGGLALDPAGNVYGVTSYGGHGCMATGCGTVFELTPSSDGKTWTRTVLYSFKGVPGDQGSGDGADPIGVTFNEEGNLYGATVGGGNCKVSTCHGTAFELRPPTKKGGSWIESVLYRFPIGSDQPYSGVVLGKSGALYGSTVYSVYQLVLLHGAWTENVLTTGGYIYGGVILDEAGNLYGTALFTSQYTNGIVYKLTPPAMGHSTWTQTVIHAFASGNDGQAPDSGLTFGLNGMLYGTTLRGGNDQCQVDGGAGCGIVFTIAP
jgi:uncharacterized repeat protein (TIGR03803 family)